MFRSEKSNGCKEKLLCLMCTSLMTAMFMIAGLSSPRGSAQVAKGAPSTAKLTPQQVQDALRAKLHGRGKIKPKISNPRAGDSSIIGVLRSQRQAAEAERQEILKTQTTPGDGSVRPAGPSANPNNAIRSGAPLQPAGTASAPAKGAAMPPASVAVSPPCMQSNVTINGQATGVLFTPIAEWNLYTIKGCGFGNRPGNIYLQGPFAGGRIQLQVLPSQERGRLNWSNTAIIATVDPQLRGEIDRDNITLVIEPAGGIPIQKSGFKFYAARETVLLQSIPERAVRFGEPFPKSGPQYSIGALNTPSQLTPGMSADVIRESLESVLVLHPTSDYFDFSLMSPGFQAESLQFAQYDSGFGNNCESQGDWNMQWDGNNIRVTLKVWGCNAGFLETNLNSDYSLYSLSVWVSGPRGVNPWADARSPKVGQR